MKVPREMVEMIVARLRADLAFARLENSEEVESFRKEFDQRLEKLDTMISAHLNLIDGQEKEIEGLKKSHFGGGLTNPTYDAA